MSDGDAILAAVPLPTNTATAWVSTVATRRSGFPPSLHLGTHQLGRGLGTSPSTGGLLGTAAAGRGAGSGGGWNVLLPLADLHCRGLSFLVIRRNGWISKWPDALSMGQEGGRTCEVLIDCGLWRLSNCSDADGRTEPFRRTYVARAVYVHTPLHILLPIAAVSFLHVSYRRRSAKPPLLPRFQATPLARSAHLFGYIYDAPCSLCIALRHIHQTMATSDKYDRQLRLWGASGQRALGETCIVLINATASGTETLKNLGKCIMCFVGTCTRSSFVVLSRCTHPPSLGC